MCHGNFSGNLLLEEHGTETRVERTKTLLAQDLGETRGETGSEGGLRDETDTGSLKRAESNVGEEFGSGGGSEVDGGSVLRGILDANLVDALLLEEFVTTELEGTLEEVTGGGGTETSEKSASTLVGDDLTETTDHTLVVGDGVKLDTGLDADFVSIHSNERGLEGIAYTSTGVSAPWVTEQQTAPAKANLP